MLRDPVTAMEALTEHSKSIPSDVKYARRPFVLWAPFSTVWRNDQPTSTQPTEGVGAWQFIQHQLKELVHAAMQPEQVEVIKRDAAKEWENPYLTKS